MKHSHFLIRSSAALMLLLNFVLFNACEQDLVEPGTIVDADATAARAIYSSRTVSFSHSDGTYSTSEASTDFGNIGGWNESRAYISGGTGRILLLRNALSSAGGVIANVDISDGSEYEVT
ncbi:MAG TPA: hypothetical protein VEB86_12475, partial [Chryseosolibacter sp.]|nr:hypothetical protein [Chryseosolibacter sp.]